MMKSIIKKIVYVAVKNIYTQMQKYESEIARDTLPKFGNNPKDLKISYPRSIQNPGRIFIGDNVALGKGSVIRANDQYPSDSWIKNSKYECTKETYSSRIEIGNNVTSTGGLQIVALNEIIIEDEVMFASNVFICDALHGFENTRIPYKYQPLFRISPIKIKKGSWIGQNVVIMPGVTIGEMSIIGANSVVTQSIPDRCIAVGSPAKVIKMWDGDDEKWVEANYIEKNNSGI